MKGNPPLTIRVKFKIHKLYTVILAVILVVFLDVTITSSSHIALRYLYDVFLALLFLPFSYILVLLLSNKGLANLSLEIGLPKKLLLLLSFISNSYVVTSAFILEKPEIGRLSENIILQGLVSLPYILIFVAILINNALILYKLIHKTYIIQFYKIPAYALAILGIEASTVSYTFHIWSVNGMRATIVAIHLLFIVLAVYLLARRAFRGIKVLINSVDIILTCISIGVLMLILTSLGIYNLFSDVSVVLSSALSIIERYSLEPYYNATSYYPAIGGFVSIIFAYMTGLKNILLASNLPFLASYLFLPFIIYHLVRLFTRDERIALLGVYISLLMDGLAIILLPAYIGKITYSTVNWYISPMTGALYSSNISHLWLTPYKMLAMASAIGCSAIIAYDNHARLPNIMFAAALLFLSLTNPRYTFLAILLLLVLALFKKNSHIIETAAIFLFTVIFLGPLTNAIFYKTSAVALSQIGFNPLIPFVKELIIQQLPITIVMLLGIATILLIILITLHIQRKQSAESMSHAPDSKFSCDIIGINLSNKFKNIATLMIIVIILFITITAYLRLPAPSNVFLSSIRLIVLRYHILVPFLLIYLLARNTKMVAKFFLILLFFYLGATISRAVSLTPIFFTCLTLPLIDKVFKGDRKLSLLVIILITLGILSSTFYSGTVKSIVNEEYVEFPEVLKVLLSYPSGTTDYTPSYYSYFVGRLAEMSHLHYVREIHNASLVLIDRLYIKESDINNLLNDESYTMIYDHEGRFMIFAKSTS